MSRSPGFIVFAFLIGAISAGGAMLSDDPRTFADWVLVAVVAVAGGLVNLTVVLTFWPRLSDALKYLRPLLGKASLFLTVVALSAVNGVAIYQAWPLVRRVEIERRGCPQPVQLRLLSTPEGLRAAQEIAHSYESDTAERNFDCPAVDIYVYDLPPADAQQALAFGWADDRLSALGPRPDLWLPGSSHYRVSPVTSRGWLAKVDSVSVASTPIVLAVPDGLAGHDVRLDFVDITWREALNQVWERGWGVARPDPARSPVGRLATMAIYDTWAQESGESLAVVDARAIESRLSQTLDTHGYPLGNEIDLLCRHLRPREPEAAVIVTEQQMLRFNGERALGGACATLPSPGHTNRMKGIYPTGTRGLDYPVVRLEWTDSSEDQLRQAREFTHWLTTPSGRAALFDTGLRPLGHPHGLPGVVFDATPPAPEALARVIDLHERATRPGRVLLALDASGSMRDAAGGRTRLDVAKQGIVKALTLLGQDNELGLWVFSGTAHERLVPLGPAEERGPRVEQVLPGVVPGGDTPLYDTIVEGVKVLAAKDDVAARAMVVLSDGEDSSSRAGAAQVLDAVSTGGVRVFIVAVGEASCSSQTLHDIAERSAGSCRQATFGNLEETLRDVISLLWKGA